LPERRIPARAGGEVKEKILVVEDNPQNMRLVEMTLRASGYEIIKAVDGEQALEVATRESPDLIVMDIQLPKITGDEVTRRLRQQSRLKGVPIIALTAYAMKGDEQRFIEAGCDAYVAKPINTREFPALIASLLKERR
jgi:CheY-like chemotaxis protein